MSYSVRPHKWQPTRLPRPWDSPGKNTGVGCHFLLQCMKVKGESEVTSVVSNSVQPHRRQPTRLPRPWDSPDRNTEVSCHFLLQCMKVKGESEVTQSCLTLCDPMNRSTPGLPLHHQLPESTQTHTQIPSVPIRSQTTRGLEPAGDCVSYVMGGLLLSSSQLLSGA